MLVSYPQIKRKMLSWNVEGQEDYNPSKIKTENCGNTQRFIWKYFLSPWRVGREEVKGQVNDSIQWIKHELHCLVGGEGKAGTGVTKELSPGMMKEEQRDVPVVESRWELRALRRMTQWKWGLVEWKVRTRPLWSCPQILPEDGRERGELCWVQV